MTSEFAMLVTKKSGFLKREACIVSFFKDEVLVTTITKEKQNELFASKKKEVKEAGGGLVKQTIALQRVLPEYTDKIKKMEQEDIKKENTETIVKSSITKIKFTRASKSVDMESGSTSQTQGKLILFVNDNKIKFQHVYEDNTGEIKAYLNNYLK